MSSEPQLHPAVRPAEESDLGRLRELIVELATYERAASSVKVTLDQLRTALFGPQPNAFALVADRDGDVVGFALYFLNFSTWEGVHGIYLEDLYVCPPVRGIGLGKALLQSLAAIAVSRGYARFDWSVLNWNSPSIDFYEAMGAVPMSDWTVFRLSGSALAEAASGLGALHPVGSREGAALEH